MKITQLALEDVKEYLRIDFNDDDKFLSSLLLSSKSYIQNYLGFKFDVHYSSDDEIPDEFTIAALALISHWYENRQIHTDKALGPEMNYIFSGLLDLHRSWNAQSV